MYVCMCVCVCVTGFHYIVGSDCLNVALQKETFAITQIQTPGCKSNDST